MRDKLKRRFSFSLITIIFIAGFIFMNQAKGQQEAEESQIASQKTSDDTRIVILTSGPAEFSSYWLSDPPRLVIEFQSRNVISQMENEVIVNQGVLKRITSSYFEEGIAVEVENGEIAAAAAAAADRTLKSLTFELTQKMPYKIWQENNSILLDIQAPLETPVFHIGGEEIFTGTETSNAIIKRLEAMDVALTQVGEGQAPLEITKGDLVTTEAKVVEVDREAAEEIRRAKEEVVSPEAIVLPTVEPLSIRKPMVSILFWFGGLALISYLGFLIWRRYAAITNQKLKEFNSELEQKNKLLEQERLVRKAIEKTSLQREKEYQQVKDSFESLKGALIEKGLQKRELSTEKEESSSIPEQSDEKRHFARLGLNRDYSRTIILRIGSQNRPESIKLLAKNISFGGVCFETKESFEEKESINLRLFFYGDIVPMMRTQAHIVWRKEVTPINYYGVSFDSLEKKDKLELNRYIESKIER